MKKFSVLLAFLLVISVFAGCDKLQNDGRVKVVALNFAAYDFCRAVAGESAEVSMLLDPGTDAHSYEPSPEDIVALSECDLFVYTGGESDSWVKKVLDAEKNGERKTVRMMDCSELLFEGDEHEGHHAHAEADEHVWMSPDNALRILDAICESLIEINPDGKSVFTENAARYKASVSSEAALTKKVIADADCSSLVVADRFPLKYFCHYYSLDYTAAFDACDVFADADAATVASLIDAVKTNGLQTVFYITGGSGYVADTVCRETGAEKLELNALHTIKRDDFLNGITYVDVMEFNREQLQRGLTCADN